ncbi:nucleotide exchange factor GrpE [Levilactobacillus bambusae]|uniref:nucleotide exchange factor GrpE n=1 Tax=Levilactobacillus bambusae TaxID=2024736 RepID=UPI001403B7F8|nr:nucleotide exchange factor GrpE [Levilactobacillus bambusae]
MTEKKQDESQLDSTEQVDGEAASTDQVVSQEPTTEDTSAGATSEFDDLKAERDAMEDRYLRAEAEIQNMSTRFKKEQANTIKYDGQKLAKAILPVVDNLERALDVQVDDDAGQQLQKGVQMTLTHLQDALKDNGISVIPALGEPFDPKVHQAIQTVAVEDGQKPDTVVQVFQSGYLLKDRVLRPAMVVVAQ